MLEDRHHEDEALEVFKSEYGINLEVSVLDVLQRDNGGSKRERK